MSLQMVYLNVVTIVFQSLFPIPLSETRLHGVGYFAFSHDEEQRQQQLQALNRLHEQVS